MHPLVPVFLLGIIFLIVGKCVSSIYTGMRKPMFERLARSNKCSTADTSEVQNFIEDGQLYTFKQNNPIVLNSIEKELQGGKLFLADLQLRGSLSGSNRNRRYYSGNTSNESIIYFPKGFDTICIVVSENLRLPNVYMTEHSLLSKALVLVGGQDINFYNDSVFSDRFDLQGNSEINVRDYFKKSVRAKLCKTLPSGVILEMTEGKLLIRTNKAASEKMAASLIKIATDLFLFFRDYEPYYDED